MGVVYLARQLHIGREVALKVLRPGRTDDEGAIAQFLIEAKAASQLTSPHTVTLFDVGRLDAGYYLVMEYLEGRTLSAEMKRGPLPWARVHTIVNHIALSLAEAHAVGVVHRDIKPLNVMLVQTPGHDDRAKVVDFGLALLVGGGERRLRSAGTPYYMAPEVIHGGAIDARTDVYALAMVAYELLTGRHPFEDASFDSLLQAQLETLPPPLDAVCDVPPDERIVELLARSLAKPPRLRPRDGAAFQQGWAEAREPLSSRSRAAHHQSTEAIPSTSSRFQTVADIALTKASSRFVGRHSELENLNKALRDPRMEPRVVIVHGAPGVGKTALAKMVRLGAEAQQHRVYWLSCGHVQPTPPGIFEALARVGLPSGLQGLGHGKQRDLLVVDGLEHCGSLAGWLLTEELLRAGPRAMVLMTSREPLGTKIEQDVALAPFLRSLSLAPLSESESRELLATHDVAPELHARLFALTGGHALSLSLLASSQSLLDEVTAKDSLPTALVAELARELFRHIDDPARRRALYCLGIASSLDEGLLVAMLDDAGAAARQYPWLSAQSFVHPIDTGLVPHDLVRDSLFEELRRHDPFLLETLSRRCCIEIAKRMRGLPLERQRYLAFQGLYARRVNPITEALVQSRRMGRTYLDRGNDDDIAQTAQLIAAYECDAAASSFVRMCELQPDSFFMVRSADSPREGMTNSFRLDTEQPLPLDDAPLAKAVEAAKKLGIRDFHCIRFAYSFETGHFLSPEIASVFFSGPEVTGSFDPVPRFTIVVTIDPERLAHYASRTFVSRLRDADVEMGGVKYGLWLLDLERIGKHDDFALLCASAMPMMLAALSGLVDDASEAPAFLQPPTPRKRPFFEAVRSAFEHLREPEGLRDNSLLRSGLPLDGDPRERALADLLGERVSAMRRDRRLGGLGDVLHATYCDPGAERVPALSLHLPWSTYRSRLEQALEIVADDLAALARAAHGERDCHSSFD